MKKYLLITSILAFTPSIALASWWNPSTWFEHNTSTQQTLNVDKSEVSTDQQPSSTTESSSKAQIDLLTNQNSVLTAKLVEVESELASVQKNYAICQGSLATKRNPSVNTQQVTQQIESTSTTLFLTPDSATILLDDNSPLTSTVTTTRGQYPNLPVLKFDIHSSQQNQRIDSITIDINSFGSGMTNTASLYSGDYQNTPIATGVVSNGSVVFSNIQSPYQFLKDSPYPYNVFTVKLNVSGLGVVGSSQTISASISKAKILDSRGQSVDVKGTVQGNVITVNTL